ncbi:ferritin-like domain-containing protein [Halegenticoccus tardaugens]|uniref:ferritin-like domain-containing protein n=1 Tax=Halegenticoccus tardaugens TaxID=2071624 RepID=UPI00100B5DAA|nr:ferritin-like domain-containing protein [Halegenticoccus tardaugens]
MDVGNHVSSNHQLVRLLQLGIVLEEVVEARATQHHQSLSPTEQADLDPTIENLLAETREESAHHRNQLEDLLEQMDAETMPAAHIEQLVQNRYDKTKPEDFDDILYDQLHAEESAYKFYDDLIAAINESDVTFEIDRTKLLAALEDIREEEKEGVKEVTELMEDHP